MTPELPAIDPALEPVRRALSEEGIHFADLGEDGIESVHELQAVFRLYVEHDRKAGLVRFTAVAPARIPETMRAGASEYAMRANVRNDTAWLQIDPDSGEIAVRAAVDLSLTALTERAVRDIVRRTVGTLDHHYPGLMRLAYGRFDARAAVESVTRNDKGLN